MRKLVVIAFVAVFGVAMNANAAVTCIDFLAMSVDQKAMFVRGLIDGMGTTFGVLDTFSRHLQSGAKTSDEKAGIVKMHEWPRDFLSKGCCLSESTIREKMESGCAAQPALPAGNMLTDVMSGKL